MGKPLKALLAYNPVAGRYPSGLLAERSAQVFREKGWEINLEQTKSAGHITELAAQAAADRLDAFIIAGGDGSVNCAMRGLIGSHTALGVLPAGTSNVFAQEIGLPGISRNRMAALEQCARLLANGEVTAIDVGLCNKEPFLLWAGVGLDAFVIHRIEPRPRWLKQIAVLHFSASILWYGAIWPGIELRVEVDDKYIEGHYILAVISNIRLYAGGLATLSPRANLDDNKLELWLFNGENLLDTIHRARDLLSGRHITSEHVTMVQFERLLLRSERPTYVQMDGDPADTHGPIQITIAPKALQILRPSNK